MIILKEALLSKTILIVDDRINNLQLLSRYLDDANYTTLIAQDGDKAISTAKTVQPDLILLDVMMPGIDGFEVCRYLKSEAVTKDIPIIFMTALTETKDKVQGFKLGAVDYITKPVEEEELLARVKTHLSHSYLYRNSLQEAAQRKLLFEKRILPSKHLHLEKQVQLILKRILIMTIFVLQKINISLILKDILKSSDQKNIQIILRKNPPTIV